MQRVEGYDASAGLMYYGARYYDAAIGRFVQADTIIPNLYNPQALNRYAYVRNNPVRYTDPTGHRVCEDVDCRITEPDLPRLPAETRGEQWPSGTPTPAGVPTVKQTPTVPGGVPTPPPGTPTVPTHPEQETGEKRKTYRINWDLLVNPIVWEEAIHINVAPVIAAEFGVFFIAATFLPCATEVGCVAVIVMAPTTVPAAASSFVAAGILAQMAIEYDKMILNEIIEVK